MKLRVYAKSFFSKNSIRFLSFLKSKLSQLKIIHSNIVSLPCKIKKFCVLTSPHADKDSREQFELRFYKYFVDLILPHKLDKKLLKDILYIKSNENVFITLKKLN